MSIDATGIQSLTVIRGSTRFPSAATDDRHMESHRIAPDSENLEEVLFEINRPVRDRKQDKSAWDTRTHFDEPVPLGAPDVRSPRRSRRPRVRR